MSSSPSMYGVFISFRGEDTRTEFTSHLHTALCKQNIKTFIDYNLERGDEVWPALAKAIQSSHISIVVFSVRYAFSKWCLDELCEILECRQNHGQVVIPVFYKIDPSHIRNQRESYAEAFTRHEEDLEKNESNKENVTRWKDESNKEKVSRWKNALNKAGSISGWDSSTHGDDSQLIENIVNDVWQKLSLRYPHELKGLIEIDENSEKIESLLEKFPRIGIWGMGGIGKTTIARKMFAKHFPRYDSVCFLENIREESEKFGRTFVRDKLFSKLLKRQIATAEVLGSTFIKSVFSGQKAFIVLDDVNDDGEVEYLCGELGDFGPHSKLIITTRDRHTLSERVDHIYEVKKWDVEKSLKLLSLGAFDQSHPKKGYENLSDRAVAYAGGIPLALKVLGLHFRGRKAKFWKSELENLENNGESLDNIQKVLQVSYDGLTQRQQAIFLDIAFFFKGEDKNFVTRILDGCGFNAISGIEILEDKAFISVSNSERIQMHDLLQQMALDIVRKKSTVLGERSRLRDVKEVCDVLKNSKGTDKVEGITLDLSLIADLHLQADTFNMMTNLRFLRLYVPLGEKRSGMVHHPGFHNSCFDELRYLEWNGYPLSSLPPNFCAKFLVEIRMPYSHIKELWQGKQDLANLETIDLSESKQLMELPDLSEALKLKWVYLSGCENLCDVHPSLLSIKILETLILDGCTNLKTLKFEKQLSYLQKFSVDDCSGLEEFSVSSGLIERLDLRRTKVKILDSSIGSLSKLLWLNIEGSNLEYLPDELSRLTSLEELRISNCGPVNKEKLHVLCNGLLSLKLLHLKYCYKLFELPDNISALSSLYELRLDGSSVEKLPASIKLLENLEILSSENCKKLQCLPELPTCIKELPVTNCTSLVTISTLKTFAVQMKGKDKHISFQNGTKLNDSSLLQIMEDTKFTMMSAACHNVFVRRFGVDTHSYNYNSVGVCLPGSYIPEWFAFRTIESSMTIELPDLDQSSHLLGFIYSVVLRPSLPMGQCGVQIQCLQDDRDNGFTTKWHDNAIKDLDSDHVFAWYDPLNYYFLLGHGQQNKRFHLCVTTASEEREGLIHVKEFGVHPICFSELELRNFLVEASNFESKLKLELGLNLRLVLDLLQGYNREVTSKLCYALENSLELDESLKSELESRRQAVLTLIENESSATNSQIQNQEQNLSDYIVDPKMVEVDSVEEGNGRKDHFSEGIKSTSNETKTGVERDGHITITESTNAGVKPPIVIETFVEDANDEATSSGTIITQKGVKDSEGKETKKASSLLHETPIQEAQTILSPSDSSLLKEKMEVTLISSTQEPIPLDVDYINKLIEEDPMGALDSFLSEKFFVSSMAQQSTTHNVISEVDSAPWDELINNLRDLVFGNNLFRRLDNDTMSNEIRDLLRQIEKYFNKMPEDIVSGINNFNDFYTEVLENSRKCNECEEEQKTAGASYQMTLEQMKQSKADFERVTTLIDSSSEKLTSINNQITELERKLLEAKQERSFLQSMMDKCENQKKDVIMKSASLSHEAKNHIVRIHKARGAQKTLDEVHQNLYSIYEEMRANPPF